MEILRNKVIRKKTILKERLAHIARVRHQKDKDVVIARVQELYIPTKYIPENRVYDIGMVRNILNPFPRLF